MICPTRAFYRPGEPVTIPVPGHFRATLWHLEECIAELEGADTLAWLPPAIPKRGYRVHVNSTTGEHWTAFDVLNHWTDAPRYGYLFDFSPDRPDFDLDWLLAHHVNGLQFYDWQYRHDTLLPPDTLYTDPLGRRLSLNTVRRLIDAAHARGMAAMPYTAIYAASPDFAAVHPEWGLYDAEGNLYDFAEGFLKIMNPASPWRDHFVRECRAMLETLPFDGVHVDQYGEPRTGFGSDGRGVDLPGAFGETLKAVRAAIPDHHALLFNLVHNWPLEAISTSSVGFLYCELWPPQTTLGDLVTVATLNWKASDRRPPVIAAYINPEYETTIRLVQSVIAASGGYHIAHGENGLYLCDPYFPRSERPSPTLARFLRQIADFSVAYEELLVFTEPTHVDAAVEDDLWLIGRRASDHLTLNLINAQPEDRWDMNIMPPEPRQNVRVSVQLDQDVHKVWCVSPDRETPPQSLEFSVDGGALTFIVPHVDIWTLACLQLGSGD